MKIHAHHDAGQLPSPSLHCRRRFACLGRATQELTTSADLMIGEKEDGGLTPLSASPAQGSDADVLGIGFPLT